jgi:glycosyltransferase involved in cell wall biosynthesis
MPLVSISDDQRKPLPHAKFMTTIHHGIPADLHRPSLKKGKYFAFLGRISPEKRPDRAIRIARAAGIPLKIAAKVDKVDEEYFRREILPLIDGPGAEFIGEINEREKTKFLGDAAALLFPVDWPEPFGLVMIEAMACGTPVLAFRCGSIPEVIEDGVPAKWSTASKKLSRRCRKSCLMTAVRCGNDLKKDSPLREWPKIM